MTKADIVVCILPNVADVMLRLILAHSERYDLCEQFDDRSGYEKSVHNWGYAAFLSSLRARKT